MAVGGAPILLLLLGSGCSEAHTFHAPDIDLPPPSDVQIEAWSTDAYRKDPRQVAHHEIVCRVDVPWKAEPYHAVNYTFIERNSQHPDWGSYVTRGYTDRAGRMRRYRVKVSRAGDVWYATQLSRFIDVELGHPAMEDDH